jgi:hypothetical protein
MVKIFSTNSRDDARYPHQRLYAWKQSWNQDPTWPPWHFEVHGAHHHIFSDEEERAISDHLSENYLLHGRLFTNAMFVQIATTAWLEKYRQTELPFEFQCSAGFIAYSKQRNHFSSRSAHMKWRPSVTKQDRMHGMMTLSQLLCDVPDHERIINVDESCWRVHPGGLRTWAPTSAQNIQLFLEENEKESFAVVAAPADLCGDLRCSLEFSTL